MKADKTEKQKPARPAQQEEHVDLPMAVQRPAWTPGQETPRYEDTENWGKTRRSGCGRDSRGRFVESTYYVKED